MKLSPNWRKAHRRYSVWALAASGFLQGVWASIPNAPLWVVVSVQSLIAALGLLGAYLAQSNIYDADT
jgi:hypothetical protein